MAIRQTISCPYSIYSLLFYLLIPIARLANYLWPTILGSLIANIVLVSALVHCLRLSFKKQCLVQPERHPRSNQIPHQHSAAITWGIIIRSVILGILLTIGILIISHGYLHSQTHLIPLGIYLALLSFFHYSEFFVTSLTNPSTLDLSSFLLDQSSAYATAITSSILEFLIGAYFFPTLKQLNWIAILGLIIAVAGEIIRKVAMLTAGENFTHTISTQKRPDHRLVTHGIYSVFRHPSYAGWLYWAVGTQILLQNPICSVLFTVITHNFFNHRILYEEAKLVEFFGQDYEAYRRKVGLWMPMIFSSRLAHRD